MAEYVRVATFDADNTALDALVAQIDSMDGAPEGLPATRITVLADRSAGRVVVATRFGSAEDLATGSAVLEGMTPPPDGGMHRISVESFEVVLERHAH
jgi:hypothetical protein